MSRLLAVLVLVCVPLVVAGQAGRDPVVRMAAMRTALEKAKTLRIAFHSEIESEKAKFSVKGTLLLGEGNKSRLAMKMNLGEKSTELLAISDGKTKQTFTDGNKSREKPVESKQRQNILAMIERGGIAVPMFTIRAKKDAPEPDIAAALQISNRKFKGTEKSVYKCSYTLAVEGKAHFRVELWTDLDSHLPLRRVLEVEKGADPVTIRETYTVEVEPKLKADVFELRKDE